ncbi:hypothetical protein [Sphingopyxis sp. GC21]|uniref:hypothetical protein n=1 Tax=Sphingopyxis sp. GC21 TaxID=2933562 RepID=UPI0021E42665|nr:hypothetical protein [Sphingopyxis sp. GC21]
MNMALVSSTMMLSACGDVYPSEGDGFCKPENRRIPENEMKARLLLSIHKQHQSGTLSTGYPYGHGQVVHGLPDYLEAYLIQQLPASAPDTSIRATLQTFVEANPLCCQITTVDAALVNDKGGENRSDNPYYNVNFPGRPLGELSKHPDGETYFANFYVLNKLQNGKLEFSNLSEDGNLLSNGTIGPNVRNSVHVRSAAYSCGFSDVNY